MPAWISEHRLGNMAAELRLGQKQQAVEVKRPYQGVLILFAAAEGHGLLDQVARVLVLREHPDICDEGTGDHVLVMFLSMLQDGLDDVVREGVAAEFCDSLHQQLINELANIRVRAAELQ